MPKKNLIYKNKKFFDKWAGHYDKKIFKNWLIRIREKIIDYAEIKKNSKILDSGCGTGELLRLLLLKKKNLRLYGVDVSSKMLEIAKQKLKKNANLKLSPVEKINFKNNYFDYIFSEDSFHHYSNQGLVMDKFYKILKKNGKLIIADFNFGIVINKIFHWLEPGNNKMHSKKEFIKLFKKHGFKKIRQRRINLIEILTIGEK